MTQYSTDPIGDFLRGGDLFAWHLSYQKTDEFKADEAQQIATEQEYMDSEARRQSNIKGQKRYRDTNPELIQMRTEARKHRWALYDQQRGNCYHCGKALGKSFEIDHIVPLIKGGTNDLSNLCVCHGRCNRKKGAKVVGAPEIDE